LNFALRISQHEATHAGLIGLLRRLLGYPPIWVKFHAQALAAIGSGDSRPDDSTPSGAGRKYMTGTIKRTNK
jgi:hypothetical protein